MPLVVDYKQDINTEQIVNIIKNLENPEVLLWFIGTYGLKKEGVKFYKESLILPTLDEDFEGRFQLVDLTAWGAFKNPNIPITKSSKIADVINAAGHRHLNCIKASDIINTMKGYNDKIFVHYFKNALQRPFISKSSANKKKNGVLVHEIFKQDFPIFSDWQNMDTAQFYSTLQYMEACMIVKFIIDKKLQESPEKDIEIVFALMNDELEYYQNETNAFSRDIEFIIDHFFPELLKNKNISIKFFSFHYSINLEHRPYNAPGKTIKSKNFNIEELTTIVEKPSQEVG